MKLKKSEISEIIDDNGNLIGDDDLPKNGSNLETRASKTTDYNAKVAGQNYANDFLGRFGFYFYESKEDADSLKKGLAMLMYEKFLESLEYYHKNPDLLAADYKEHFADGVKKEDKVDGTDEKWANKIMDLIEPFMKKKLDESTVEEALVDKPKNVMKEKKEDNDVLSKEKVKDFLNKSGLKKKEIQKIVNIIED